MEETVTLSLDRFKQLEKSEKEYKQELINLAEELSKGDCYYIHQSPYYGYTIYTKDQAIGKLIGEIEVLKSRIEKKRWWQKIFG